MNLVYMKTKIYLGILSFVLGLSLASCSEDDGVKPINTHNYNPIF